MSPDGRFRVLADPRSPDAFPVIRPPARRVGPSDRAAIPDERCRDELTEYGEPIEPPPVDNEPLRHRSRIPVEALVALLRPKARSCGAGSRRSPFAGAIVRRCLGSTGGWLPDVVGHSLSARRRGLLAREICRGPFIYSMAETVTLPTAMSPCRSDGIHRSGRRSFGRSLRASFHRE